MSKFQQLILKALSTESDSEALSCLALAKREYKKLNGKEPFSFNTLELSNLAEHYLKISMHNAQSAVAWREQAQKYYSWFKDSDKEKKSLLAQLEETKGLVADLSNTIKAKVVVTAIVAFTSGITIGLLAGL